MKKFLEEYGMAILATIVVIFLIAISTPIKNTIQSNTTKLINKYSNMATAQLKALNINLNPNDIIELDNKKYVVLQKKGGTRYLVMDIDGIGKREFNIDRNGQDPSKCAYVNGIWKYETCNNQYENSNIDIYLNETYYNSLSFKDAIIEQDVQQNFYQQAWTNPNYIWVNKNDTNYGGCNENVCVKQNDGTWISWREHTPIKGKTGGYKFDNKGSKRSDGLVSNVIKRKIFLPSINEISSIANINDQYDMDQFIRNSNRNRLHIWLRDGNFKNTIDSLHGNHYHRSLNYKHVRNLDTDVRPTFVIDLSKIDYIDTQELFIK